VRRLALLGSALAGALVLLAAPAGAGTGRSIFTDPLTEAPGQHATAVEPDTFAWGNTVVAVFQVGRRTDGGADAIGWATSTDRGATWRSGLLPALTPAGGGGPTPFTHASDPVIAYDAVHRVWLAGVLALGPEVRGDPVSALLVSRSGDGMTWSAPVTVSPSPGHFAHDKNWTACDAWPGSPFAGRCYTAWSAADGEGEVLVSASSDGGLTWSAPAVATGENAVGAQPVARPDGTLVMPYLTGTRIESVRSRDGGRTFEPAVRVAEAPFSPVGLFRALPLPSVEVAGDGRVWAAWSDCRFQPACEPGRSTNDVALASSADGRVWSALRRVPLGRPDVELDYVIPGLAVDRATRGRRTRLAVVSYVLGPDCAGRSCGVAAASVVSSNSGENWTAPATLASSTTLNDAPSAGSQKMLADYLSASWLAGGFAVSVATIPVAPFDGRYHVDAVAGRTRAPPSAYLTRLTSPPRQGRLFRVRIDVAPASGAARLRCSATLAGRALAVASARVAATGRATCAWRIPARSAGRALAVTVRLGPVVRRLAARVGGRPVTRR
jgi:hypothetical protein